VCWNLWKIERMTFDEIATREHLSVVQVGNAVQRTSDYKALHSDQAVDLAVNEMILKRLGKVEQVLTGAMGANIVGSEKRGRVDQEKWVRTRRPDHATRLKAAETFKGFIETIRPKGGGVSIALQQNNAGAPGDEPRAHGNTFEERLRRLRQAKGLANHDEVIEAEFASPSSLADELEGVGIELDEDPDEQEEPGQDQAQEDQDQEDQAQEEEPDAAGPA
jgi:hypothetical protein